MMREFRGYEPTKYLFSSMPNVIRVLGKEVAANTRSIAMDLDDWSECIRKAWIQVSLPWIFGFTLLEEFILTTTKVEILSKGPELSKFMRGDLGKEFPDGEVPSFTVTSKFGVQPTEKNSHCFSLPWELLGTMGELFQYDDNSL